MIKNIYNLQPGDIFLRKENNEKCTLKEILKSSDEATNYGFGGFYVREKILKKFFKSGESGIFIYND